MAANRLKKSDVGPIPALGDYAGEFCVAPISRKAVMDISTMPARVVGLRLPTELSYSKVEVGHPPISPRFVVDEAGATNSNTVHGVFLSAPLLADALAAASLNSSSLLSAEVEGGSYGGSVPNTEPGEAVRVLMPHLTQRLNAQLEAILPKSTRSWGKGKLMSRARSWIESCSARQF